MNLHRSSRSSPPAPRPTRTARATTLLLLAGLVVGLAACGIPTDSSPRPLGRDALPAALAPETTTSLGSSEGLTTPVHLYLVRNQGTTAMLAPMTSKVTDSASLAHLAEEVLDQLVAVQPPQSGATKGLTNAIPSSVRILDAHMDGNVLDLDVSNLDNVENTQQRLAFAQMVFTATDLTGIDAVRFSMHGQPAQVPLGTATSKTGQAVTHADYGDLEASH